MNALFAKLAISELRAQAGTCSGSCSSYACFKGGPAAEAALVLALPAGAFLLVRHLRG
jgi:hypothetical protein